MSWDFNESRWRVELLHFCVGSDVFVMMCVILFYASIVITTMWEITCYLLEQIQ